MELDALRGVAACAVVVLHFSTNVQGHPLVERAWLAVDFFFLLSGFVVNHAYQGRLSSGAMTRFEFVRARLVRLMPMVVISAMVATVYFAMAGTPTRGLMIGLIGAITTIPIPVETIVDTAHWPFNPPEWSLFFEFVASFVFVFMLVGRKTSTLIVVAAIAFIMLLFSAYLDGSAYTLRLWDCLDRVIFSFTVGMILSRSFDAKQLPEIGLPFPILAAILVATFFIKSGGWFSELITATVLYPVLIISAAHWQSEGMTASASKFLGDVSYPLYILHWPVLLFVRAYMPHSWLMGWQALLAFVVLSVALAWSVSKFVEQPVRRWLNRDRSRGGEWRGVPLVIDNTNADRVSASG